MHLTEIQQKMLAGEFGLATQKSMQILTTLGKIYAAEKMVAVSSVQIAGVSYDNLGDAGLEFLAEMAGNGGKARVLTTLNPAGMDIENWQSLGISPEFAEKQQLVIASFERMGIISTCSCTPYLSGSLPHFGEHIAWAESSAVCYANSVLGARSNREGGPSALAASLTGFTPAYGMHLDINRKPSIHIHVNAEVETTHQFGALGKVIGERLQLESSRPIPYITGITRAGLEELKSFCASIATYGGTALFHIPGITPEASQFEPPSIRFDVSQTQLENAYASLSNAEAEEVDFVSLGCPHLSLQEISHLAELLTGKKLKKTFWVTTSRPVKHIADRMGFTKIIEASGAVFATDTCCVVSPIKGRFTALLTDSAKACYYASSKNKFKTRIRSFEDVVKEACI